MSLLHFYLFIVLSYSLHSSYFISGNNFISHFMKKSDTISCYYPTVSITICALMTSNSITLSQMCLLSLSSTDTSNSTYSKLNSLSSPCLVICSLHAALNPEPWEGTILDTPVLNIMCPPLHYHIPFNQSPVLLSYYFSSALLSPG